MVCLGKTIANCSRNLQFLPVMCALCTLCASCADTPPIGHCCTQRAMCCTVHTVCHRSHDVTHLWPGSAWGLVLLNPCLTCTWAYPGLVTTYSDMNSNFMWFFCCSSGIDISRCISRGLTEQNLFVDRMPDCLVLSAFVADWTHFWYRRVRQIGVQSTPSQQDSPKTSMKAMLVSVAMLKRPIQIL